MKLSSFILMSALCMSLSAAQASADPLCPAGARQNGNECLSEPLVHPKCPKNSFYSGTRKACASCISTHVWNGTECVEKERRLR